MVARIKVTYTIEEYVTLDIKDFELSGPEMADRAWKAVMDTLPGDEESMEWEWESKPRSKGSATEPPEDWYVDTPFGRAATNGHCVVLDRSPIKLRTEQDWLNAPAKKIDIAKFLSDYREPMPLHFGWFDKAFQPFQKLEGLEVKGRGLEEPAYLVLDGELIAALMPVKLSPERSDADQYFQFNSRS